MPQNGAKIGHLKKSRWTSGKKIAGAQKSRILKGFAGCNSRRVAFQEGGRKKLWVDNANRGQEIESKIVVNNDSLEGGVKGKLTKRW